MSVKAVSWVLDDLQGLKPGPSLVMLALADFADERASCFPGRERIAGRARCSVRSVSNYLRELEELGLISVERRTYSDGHGRIRRTSNRYILHLERTYSTEDAKFAPSKEMPGSNESANSAPTIIEGANSPVSKVQPVAPKEPPVIEPPVPPAPHEQSKGESSDTGRASRSDGATAPREESESSKRLIESCLPPEMQRGLAPRHRREVEQMLADRIDGGWTPQGIRDVLGARTLPPAVRSLFGLVRARLERDVPPDAPVESGNEDTSAEDHRPVYRLADGKAVPGTAIAWGDVTLAWSEAIAAGDCAPDLTKMEWLSARPCDEFVNGVLFRTRRGA